MAYRGGGGARRTISFMDHHEHYQQDIAERTEHLEEAARTQRVGEHAKHDVSAAGHDRHAGHSVAMFRDKFWLSLALTVPVVFWSTDVQHWLGYTAPSFSGSKFIPAILGTVVFVYGGLVFIRRALGGLSDHKPRMMTL